MNDAILPHLAALPKSLARLLEVKISKDIPLTPEELTHLRDEIQRTTDFAVARTIMSCFQWLHDPANIPFIEPYLYKGDVYAADRAVWTLCWLGYGQHIKDYLIQCLEPGMSWDDTEKLATGVPRAIGQHLKTHKDRDLVRLLVRWRRRAPGDPFVFSKPFGRSYDQVRRIWTMTDMGMGYAVGADPLALTDDKDLVAACVARFIAERQDG